MRSYDKFTFFYGSTSPFSQHNRDHSFTIKEIEFNCAEQFMMYGKAVLFEDYAIADAILNERDPMKQKQLGRRVKNFSQSEWDGYARDLVYVGNYAKFSQNESYQNVLYETKGTLLVEASPYDLVWGVGLSTTDPAIHDRAAWRGKNWLGEVLTTVRENLFHEHD